MSLGIFSKYFKNKNLQKFMGQEHVNFFLALICLYSLDLIFGTQCDGANSKLYIKKKNNANSLL